MLKVIDERCKPTRGTQYSACVDLRSRVDVRLEAGNTVIIPLGVKIDLVMYEHSICPRCAEKAIVFPRNDEPYCEECGDVLDTFALMDKYYIDVKPRSSIRAKGLIAGSGVIDLDYKDEIGLILYKPLSIVSVIKSIVSFGMWKTYVDVKAGERIAQAMVKRHYTDFFGITTENTRNGGVGSTGKE